MPDTSREMNRVLTFLFLGDPPLVTLIVEIREEVKVDAVSHK